MTAATPAHPDDEKTAAVLAADGDQVDEIAATEIKPDMIAWHAGQWLPVKYVTRSDRSVLIDFVPAEPGSTACRIAQPHTVLLRRTAKSAMAAE